MKTKVIKRGLWVIAAVLLAAFCAFTSIFSRTTVKADENSSVYTDVMTDLQLDNSFNAEEYPANGEDYSLQVIQIAESVNGELFVYVYQPSNATRDLKATSINISSVADGEVEEIKNYPLTLLSTEGVFDKYKVEGLEVKADIIRFYFIVSIYRAYDGEIDGESASNNTIGEIAYKVGQQWTATTYDGNVLYAVEYKEVITITDRYVGKIRYMDNFFFFNASTESHYIAFKTDRDIDDLLEADVSFTYKSVYEETNTFNTINDKTVYGDAVSEKVTLYAEDIFSKEGGLFTDTYEYKRIQTAEEFLENESDEEHLSTDCVNAVKSKEWVLRFYETEYASDGQYTTSPDSVIQNYMTWEKYYIVSDVSIFRLKFEYDGQVYNMGVVDNKESGSTIPDNDGAGLPDREDFEEALDELLYGFIDVVSVIISLIIFIGICILLFKLVKFIIKKIFNGNDG